MRMSGLRASYTLVMLAAFLMLFSEIQTKQAYAQDETITVSCFKGNTDQGNYLGEISVSNSLNAASDCNNEYGECEGQCLGCFVDSDFNQICYDVGGNKIPQGSSLKEAPPGVQTP